MDHKFDEINEKLENLILTSRVESIFDISDQFDELIREQEGATAESQAFIYHKAYEGFKAAAFSYFGSSSQTQNHHNSMLTEKLNLYQTSLDRIQSEQAKRTQEYDVRERDLRQNICDLELKAQKTMQ